ncbi:hypothetical protein ACWD7F_08475 [Streptomyces sp. NPDC005122]
MATGTGTTPADSPAALYGPVSLGFGIVALIAVALSGFVGIAIPLLAGSLAVAFGVLGLTRGSHRGRSVIGLATGSVGVLYPVVAIIAFAS